MNKGLTTQELETAMIEIGLGKDEKSTSVNLNSKEKVLQFRKLKSEISDIAKKGAKLHIPSEF